MTTPPLRIRLALLAVATLACAVPAMADVTVGISLALTGGGAALGLPTRNSLTLWPTTFGDQKVNVIVLDDGGDPTLAIKNTRRFIGEDHADVVIGSSVTPSTLAALRVATEGETPFLAISPIDLPADQAKWVFVVPAHIRVMAAGVVADLKARKVKTLGFIGYADSWGDVWTTELTKALQGSDVKIVSNERFARGDTSVTSQALKLASLRPDAIFVAASGTGAALPQMALKDRGYTGIVYHSQGSATQDFVRIAGKAADGAIMPAPPVVVSDALPDSNASKAPATSYVQRYQAGYGKDSPAVFGANTYDAMLLVQAAVPAALKAGKPGTPAFRDALRVALESTRELPGTLGVYNFSPTQHVGLDQRAMVMIQVEQGGWKVLK
jgi:branched-chain amino acid transport system substrate-binding protein